jgi:hypothetical protein
VTIPHDVWPVEIGDNMIVKLTLWEDVLKMVNLGPSRRLIKALEAEGYDLVEVVLKKKEHEIKVEELSTGKTARVAISQKGLRGKDNDAVIGQLKRIFSGRGRRGQGEFKLD